MLATDEAYNPASDTWTAIATMPTRRYGLSGNVAGNVLYALGGADSSAVIATNEAFTLEPFASFTGKLEVTVSTGSFDLNSSFTLGTGSNGINPITEDVTLQIGPYSVTIPADSFTQDKKGAYVFAGTIGGVAVWFRINPVGDNSYTLQAEGSGANLTGISNPVTVTLTIGDDTGSTQITAQIS